MSGQRIGRQTLRPGEKKASERPGPVPTRMQGVPWRALALGVCGVTLLCAVTPYNDYKLKNTPLYGNHLPIGGLFLFALWVMALNPLLRRFRPRYALQQGELLLVWAMLTTGAGLASSGLWRLLGPMVVAPAYFAGAGRSWLDLFRDAPDWLLLSRDPQSPAILWFYHGVPAGQAVPWMAWTSVVLAWGLAFALVVAFSLGLCALFRKQWVVRERLTFPLAQVPLQLVAEAQRKQPLAQNRLFWVGCLTVILLHGASTLHSFVPAFPGFPDRTETREWLQTPPWSALELPPLQVFFGIIGATFLLPADVSLSLWSIYLLFRLVRVVRVMQGYGPLALGPLNHEHAIGTGAFMILAFWLCWVARPHWREMRLALRRPPGVDGSEEPISPRVALGLVGVGMGGLSVWLHAAGIPLHLGVAIVVLFVVLILVLTRFVAESGLLFLDSTFIPSQVIALAGTQFLTPLSAGVLMATDIVLVHYPTEHVMPAIANAYALTGGSQIRPRAFTGGIVLAIVAGFCVAFVASVWLNYRFGAITLDEYGAVGAPSWSLDRAVSEVSTPLSPHPGGQLSLGLGAGLAALLIALKSRFLWWPLGPIGLAMGSTWAMDHMYFSIFLGWVCKVVVLHLGGLRLYGAALPYFFGLLLGEGLFGGMAVLWGVLTGVSTPPFFPTS